MRGIASGRPTLLLCAWLALAAARAGADALPGASPLGPALADRLAEAAAARPRDEVRTQHRDANGAPRFTNRLVLEQSPYLLQHAHNPVDWHPWGDEAFALAKRLGRPVFVSIGYSTCHWCHVMEEESFDDVEIARQLNASYVAIKVDREVRPDVDAQYMAAIFAFGRQGGWPLNVWLTPDREPFYAGTYFPPDDRDGRPGLPRVLAALAELYRDQPEQVAREASRATAAIRASLEGAPPAEGPPPPRDLLTRALRGFASRYDAEWGGLGRGTKFPGALPVPMLLRVRGDEEGEAREMVIRTLEEMARSGLRDHVGGGFHRYATDRAWRIPHFEKMLYDQARLVLDYLEAWRATQRPEFAEVARDTAAALRRDFEATEGGFYSATDADSRGPGGGQGEGLYFTWTREELVDALGADDARLAAARFGVGEEPLLEGRSVLRIAQDVPALAKTFSIGESETRSRLASIRERLSAARARRTAPLLDRKIVTAWNGLAVSALARAGFAFGEPAWVASAARAARQLLATRDAEGRLRRVRLGEDASGTAFLEDYALTIAGLLDLYEAEAVADPAWLAAALALRQRLDTDYADPAGGYYRVPAGVEGTLVRDKPVQDDGTLPPGNATAALDLLRLAALTSDDALRERAARLFGAFHTPLVAAPMGVPSLLVALDWWHDVHQEVIVVLPEEGGDAEPLLAVLRRIHQPNRVVAVVREGASLENNAKWVSLVSGKRASKGEPTAYVCENRTCRFPTRDPSDFESLLRGEEITR